MNRQVNMLSRFRLKHVYGGHKKSLILFPNFFSNENEPGLSEHWRGLVSFFITNRSFTRCLLTLILQRSLKGTRDAVFE